MDVTPNTLNYMVGGYIFFAIFMAGYIVSLVTRWKNLQREQQMLEEIEKQK